MSPLTVLTSLIACASLVSAQTFSGTTDLYGAVAVGSYGTGVPPQSYIKLTGR
jgi:hypothetical protein